ncbi:hypothetical protein NC652_014875 [Populus alba x Populus x berolinensis]|nr:hypothetical protein NC652_014875 [Populus alba x Populus x berolinensis]
MENQQQRQPSMKSRFRRVCVFCGSSPGKNPNYQHAAIQLGKQLVDFRLIKKKLINIFRLKGTLTWFMEEEASVSWVWSLKLSMMVAAMCWGNSLASGLPLPLSFLFVLSSRFPFFCCRVIPKTLMPREITGETVGEVKAVSGMHQRKAEMARQADAFIALPDIIVNFTQNSPTGGYGTLEELLEVITWAQLGIHDKPVGLLNVDGYYDSLLSFIDKAVDEGFITPAARHIIVSAHTAQELMCLLEDYEAEHSGVASKLSWGMGQQLGYTVKSDISR